jgi:glycosyltransferase involved in cell wall biosynthesis
VSDAAWLTVAIPTFNGARHLADAVRSVLAQQLPGPKPTLLILDDRSEDQTVAIARDVAGARARIEINGERLGLAGNWNRCVELSTTPWVAIFHQDDVMTPHHLAGHLHQVRDRADCGFVCGNFEVIDERGHPVSPRAIERVAPRRSGVFEAGEFVSELATRNPIRCSTATLNRAAHASAGGFDKRWRYVVDWDYWFRVAKRFPVAWIDKPTVAIRWHDLSETQRFRSTTDDIDEVATLLEQQSSEVRINPSLASVSRAEVNRRLARAYLNRAYEAARNGDQLLAKSALRSAQARNPSIRWHLLKDPRLTWRLLRSGALGT